MNDEELIFLWEQCLTNAAALPNPKRMVMDRKDFNTATALRRFLQQYKVLEGG